MVVISGPQVPNWRRGRTLKPSKEARALSYEKDQKVVNTKIQKQSRRKMIRNYEKSSEPYKQANCTKPLFPQRNV